MRLLSAVGLVLIAIYAHDVYARDADEAKVTSGPSTDAANFFVEKHPSFVSVRKAVLPNGKRKRIARIPVPREFASSPFYEARAITLSDDEMPMVEVTGQCGNKNCEKLIFRYNDATKRYLEFFRGAYSSVFVFDGHLIESGASGCCAFEYHAYKIPASAKPISGPPNIVISVSNTSTASTERPVACSFADVDGEALKPPGIGWLKFCEVYGSEYQLKQ